ncbi:MAG: N-acetyltransferase [Candidatus Altiarchaeota archaeon]|nr:N-acetyltransferase [Candidatus Altiarchaeota archaeon]
MVIRKASLGDVDQMKTLIDFYASKSRMLPRSLSYIYEHVREYTVCKEGELVIGCCALHVTWRDLAEVKSLAVDPRYMNKGVGKDLLFAALKEAKEMGINEVFTLTLESEFFLKNGFKKTSKEKLPMKIWGECIQCNKYPNCDEEALVYKIK